MRITKGTDKFQKQIVSLLDQFIEWHGGEPKPKLYEVIRPTRLCAPAKKNDEPWVNPDEANGPHLMCYKVRQVHKVCTNNINNPLVPCQNAKDCGGNDCIPQPRHHRLTGIHTNNQFGSLQVDAIKEEELCVPSTKTVQPQ